MEAKLLVILALVAAVSAGPITVQESNKCAEKCTESNKFKYIPGNTYTYDYTVDTETSMSGASEDMAKLTIQTSANVEVLSPCEFALRLQDTKLMHSDAAGQMKTADGEQQFRTAVEASELRFSFQDGVVDSVCCGASSEDAWVINFKKGILSSFQNSMDDVTKAQNLTETDIAGECSTEYEVASNGYYSTSIKKSKNMLTCTGRHHYKTMLQMTPYNLKSDMQNFPIMKTNQECVQEIQKAGVLKSTVCEETHVYRPFSNGNSGGMTSVKQVLTFKASSSGVQTRPAAIVNKDSLTFDHSQVRDSKMARVAVEQRLRDICATSRYDVRPESPRQFSELISAMKSLSQQDLEDLYRLLKTKTLCPDNEKTYKFYLDALPMVSTDAAVKVMTSLISNGDVKGVLAQAWITSFGFVQTPTSEMLLSAKALVDSDSTRDDALLPVSSMVNNYCRKMTSCDQDYAVLSIMASLERNIGYSCNAKGKNFQKVLLSLRAIGNAGHATRAIGPINKCLTSGANPLEIRVAAAEAFRRMPCEAKDDDLWSTYENGDLDSELRVAAYLAIMRCPTEATMGKMAASLVSEEDDQVGAFVYSHLTNLRQTSDPHKQDIARAAQNLAMNKEFELSALKFSRNFEMSALINKLNAGFGAESNLVWSSASQMPRSVSGNLTIDLFGEAVNVMDFGARLEGLEYLVKNVFGPYMTEDKDAQKKAEKSKAEDVEGSVYGRVFGNEMFFMHSKTTKSPFKKSPFNWLEMVMALSKKHDYALTQSMQFMDVSMIIPTCAGLPINIDVNGTGTLDLVLNGKMDLRKLGSSPRSLDIDGEMRPSAAIEITGSMSVDAMVTKTGLRMRNTLHTSTALKGRVQLQRGQLLNVVLDTPQDKMEIFNARSQFFIMHNNMEKEQEMIKENRQNYKVCSGDKLSTIAGMELCGELSFPNASMATKGPYFPLTGPSSASVTLYKRDSHNGYKLFAKRVENKKASIAQLSLNTPGSKVDRAILMEVNLNYPKQTLDAEIRSPWKKAALRGVTINNDKMKSISGRLVIDDADTYSFTSEVKVDKTKNKIQLSPMVEVIRPGADNVQLTGYVSVFTPFKSAEVDLSLAGLQKMPYTLKTSITNTKKERSIVAAFSPDGKQRYTLEANNQLAVMGKKSVIATLKSLLKVNTPSKQIVSMTANGDYREDKSLKLDTTLDIYRLLKKPANLKIALLKNAKKRGVRYDIDANLKSSTVSGKLDSFTFIKSSGLVSTKTVLGYTIPKVAKNKITLGGKFNDRSTKAYKKYTLKSNLDIAKNPEYNMGLNLDIDHKKKHSAAEVELKYGKNPKDKTKRIFWSTSLNRKLATWKAAILNFKMDALAPAQNIAVKVIGKHQHTPKMLDSTLNLNYGGKGKDVSTGVTLRDKSAKLAKYNGKAEVAWPGNSYILSSSLDQKSAKQYAHVLNLKTKSGKHTMTTVYKNAKPKAHDFNTKLSLAGLRPITLSGSTNIEPRNLDVAGEFQYGKAAYGFKTNSKVNKSPSAKVEAELYYPARRMTLLVDGGKSKSKYDGRVEASWDADKDKNQTIVIEGSAYMKKAKKAMSLSGDLSLKSPFNGYENMMSAFKYGSDESQHDFSGKMAWGGKGNQIQSTVTVKRPINLESLKLNAMTKTPFKGFKVMSIDVDHSLIPSLKSTLAGRWDKDNAKLTIEGENLGDMNNRNLKGRVALKSTIKGAKDVKVNFAHNDGAGKHNTNAALIVGGNTYSFKTNGKVTSAPSAKVFVEVSHPERRMTLLVDGGKLKSKYNGRVEASWDADDKSKVIIIDGSAYMKEAKGAMSLAGSGTFTSPFKGYESLASAVKYAIDDSQHDLSGKMSWGGKGNQMTSSLTIKKPISLDSLKLSAVTKTPFKGYKIMSIDVDHSMLPTLKSIVSGRWEKDNAKLTIAGENLGDMINRNLKGSVALKSTMKGAKDVKLNFAHMDGAGKLDSNAALILAGKTYGYDVNMGHSQNGWQINNNGDLILTYPGAKVKSSWKHKSSDKDVKCSLSSDWGKKRLMIEIDGSHDLLNTGIMKGDIKIQSPWKSVKNIELSLNHKHGEQSLINKATVKQNGKVHASSSLKFAGQPSAFDVDFAVESPWNEDFTAKINGKYSNYPVTGLAEISWSPKAKAILEGSLNIPSLNNANADLKLTTPFKGYRNIVFKASNKDVKGETVSSMNLDLGVRKSIDVENRFAFNDMKKMLRLKVITPFENMKKLVTGFSASGELTNFDGSVDFNMIPTVGKFEGNLDWQYDGDLKGKLHLGTPFKAFPYFELSASSVEKGRSRQSIVNAEYSPRQNYRFDTTYTTDYDLPMTFEATINSPYPEYDNLGVAFQHNQSPSTVVSHAEVIYQPNKKIESDINMDWSSKLEGSIVVKTPFEGYETSNVILRHEGDMDAFTSHGEVNVAEKSLSADAGFKSGYATTGTFTINTPISGLETLEISMNKKGNLNNLKGSAAFVLNKDRSQANFNYRMNGNNLKSGLSVTTPYSDNLKMSVDHNGDFESFTNKISFNFGKSYDIDSTFTFDQRQADISGNGMIKAKLAGPRQVGRINFSKTGSMEDMSFSGTASYNRDDISLNGSWKLLSGIEGTLQVKTPFNNFKNLGLTLSHEGDLYNFKTDASVNYMDNQNINGKVELTSSGLQRIGFTTELHTTFDDFRNVGLTLSHDGDMYNFKTESNINYMDNKNINGKVELTSDGLRRINFQSLLQTPFNGFRSVGCVLSHEGDLYNFRTNVNGNYMDNENINGKVELASNGLNRIQFSSELQTPCEYLKDMGLQLSHNGDLFNFKTESSLTYLNQNINANAEMSSNGLRRIRFNTGLTTPFSSMKSSQLNVEHNYDQYNMALSGGATLTTTIGQFGQGSITYKQNGDLDNFSAQVNGKYANDEAVVSMSKRGSLEDLEVSTSVSYNRQAISVDGELKTLNGIEGSLKVKTPFQGFRNVGMKMSHRGDITNFNSKASVDYKDNKNANAEIEFYADGLNTIRLITETNSDLTGSCKVTINHEQSRNGIISKADMSSSMLGDASYQVSKSGSLNDLNMEGKVTYNKEDLFNGKLTNSIQGKTLSTIGSLSSAWTEDMEFTIDHSGDIMNFNCKVRGIFNTENVVSAETSLSNNGNVMDAEGKMMYRTKSFGSNKGSVNVHKEGQLNDFSVSVSGDLNTNKVSLTAAMKVKDEITGSLSLKTPVVGYKNVGLSFKHSGNLERFNTYGDLTCTDGNKYSAKLDFYKYLLRRIETTLEVRTPIQDYEFTKFEYRHEQGAGSFKCYQTMEYGNSKKITYEMTAKTTPNPDLSVTLKTPFQNYEEMMAAASLLNNWPVASVSAKLNAGNGNEMSLSGNLDVSKDISGAMNIKTPMEDFTNVGLNFLHSGNMKNFDCEGKVTYMDNKDISGKLSVKRSGDHVTAQIKTPFPGFELTIYDYSETKTSKAFISKSTFIYGDNKMYQTTTKVISSPNPELFINWKSPIPNFEDNTISMVVDVTEPTYKFDSNVNIGGQSVSLNSALDMADEISGLVSLKTPITGYTNLGMDFKYSGNSAEGKMNYADGKDISGKMRYNYNSRQAVASAELNTPFSGFENTKADVQVELRRRMTSASSSLEYGNGQKMEASVKMVYSPNYDLEVILTTPYSQIRNIRAKAAADVTAPRFSTSSSLNYNNRNIFSSKGKLNFVSFKQLDGSLVVKTSINGLEFTKVEYDHKLEASSLDGSASLALGNGRNSYSAELKSTYYPTLDASVTVKTPIYGYSSVQGSIAYDSSYRKYETSSSLKVEGQSLYTMSSGLDYSIEPMKVFTKISTPHSDLSNVELVLTHEGEMFNFKSTGFLASPLTDNVNAEAALNYNTPYDMSVSGSLKSNMEGMDDLKFEMKNSDVSGEKKMTAVAGWTDGQQIQTDVSLRSQESWYETAMAADVSLSTPFIAVKSLSVQTEGTKKVDGKDGKLALELNGAKLLDVSGEYSTKDKYEATMTFVQPYPMQYTFSGSTQEGSLDADVYANWDRDSTESNVRVLASMNDKSDSSNIDRSVDVSVECSKRKMGVTHTQKLVDSKLSSTGKVYWDSGDDDKVSYDLSMSDSSRRNKQISDASLKLGLPSRTLELAGALSASPAAKTADATFSWDAERDTSKQVGVKATMTRGNSLRGDVTLSMPALRKEIRVDGELMLDNGRIILDSKTDISYSTDARKTLTLISKVKDISDYYSNYNYSVELGLSHPYTNIDLQMNSHLGSSDEKMTVGLETSYLTARRQTKNLALLTEINKLKKQISVQMVNPMNKIEIVGDVVSDKKLRLLNRIDDAEVMRSEMTFDSDKKFAEISTIMGSDKYSMVAEYPSDKQFQSYFKYSTPEVNRKEALLAVRLNTSRLLHSRLAWRPAVLTDLAQGLKQRSARAGVKAAQIWALMNQDIADELTTKYNTISSHLHEELEPIVNIMERSLRSIAYKMAAMQQELRGSSVFQALSDEFNVLNMEYRRSYTELIESLRNSLARMVEFPIREEYNKRVENMMINIGQRMFTSLSALEELTGRMEQALKDYKSNSRKLADSVADSMNNSTYVNYAINKYNQVKNFDISPYVTSFEMPEEMTNVIDLAKDSSVSGLKALWERPELDVLRGNIDSVYQQSSWAYKYWDVEKNLKENLESMMDLLVEIVEDEVKEMAENCKTFYKSPITVWDPEHGEIQAQVKLPFNWEKLDELPDFSPIVAKAEKMAQKVDKMAQEVAVYLPDYTTWENMKQSVSEYFPAQEIEEVQELKDFKPKKSNKLRKIKKEGKKNKKNKMRKMKQ